MTTSQQHSFSYGEQTITLETGRIARQSSGAVFLTMGDTQLLATVVGKQGDGATRDFLPLTVNYQERAYAAGNIPGGYFKREGRPAEHETLISRLIDRPLRPLFPKGFYQEVQVIITVLSADPDTPTDVLGIIAASAALAISGIPFHGPLAAARVAHIDGQLVLNPNVSAMENTKLDLVVAGTQDAVLMVESSAKELPESEMLKAVMFGHQQMQQVIQAIHDFAGKVQVTPWDWQAAPENVELNNQVSSLASAGIAKAYQLTDKSARYAALDEVKAQLLNAMTAQDEHANTDAAVAAFDALKKDHVRGRILQGEPRIDGRDLKTVRPIHVEPSLLKRTHGSALFTRGETQVISAVTLGGERSAQMFETLAGENRQRFMLHYNFQPYCVGEVGFLSAPKRREIGHGKLAWRALDAMMPSQEDFPYVIRVVAETTESNGSSSMATVCASSMALMDAGVPLKAPVAGIAMGLIKSDEQFAVLTDILGDEDHLGDMDFKVAGTEQGVTALQMDIKITGITENIMQQALDQARTARMHILGIMKAALAEPRQQLSAHAPRIISFNINPEKIRDVIGKGGATIRALTEETGASIDITDEGLVTVCAQDGQAGEETKRRIEVLVADVEEGAIYEGKVMKIVDFGAFVNILPGKDGLLHVSQIAKERVSDVNDYLKEGQTVKVKVLEVDRMGKVRLSMKVLIDA